jgi:CHAD domain-containing protein
VDKIVLRYYLPKDFNRQKLDEELSGQFAYSTEPGDEISVGLYDTFDWRLFQKDLVCFLAGPRLQLISLSSGATLQSLTVLDAPKFVWDLPAGELRRILAPILEMRALLHLGEVKKESVNYRILNRDDKTVARLVYYAFEHLGDRKTAEAGAYVQLKAVRGYPRYYRALQKFCQAMAFEPTLPRDIYHRLIEVGESTPGDYSSKLNFQLVPEMRADEATRVILQFLLETMRRNEEGIRKDIDTEFLHDFRVAVRRTRSALTQIKGVFPADVIERNKIDFSRIGGFTNRLRDLDVYLHNEVAYRAMLPAALQESILPLFTYLRGRRSEALEEVRDGLDSKEYARILHDWESFLYAPLSNAEAAPNAARPVLDLASQRIYNRYRSIVKVGNKILDNSEDDLLHNLRIECKKLRNLMEFFASLYPRKKITILIKQLKILQDNLGEINDLYVQGEYLLKRAMELPIRGAAARQTLVAIGGLVEALDERKMTEKGNFVKTFTHFASTKNRRLFSELFKESRKKERGTHS